MMDIEKNNYVEENVKMVETICIIYVHTQSGEDFITHYYQVG